jgi:ribosome biogenesis GTPase
MDWEHDPGKKEQKRERKVAQRTDRSRFKKTDAAKREQLPIPSHLPRARVLSIRSQEADLLLEDGTHVLGVVRGALKQDTFLDKRLLTVGDWVRVKLEPELGRTAIATIEAVEPRRSVLQRAEHFQRRKRQTVAANVDQVAIVMSVGLPALKPALIDRFLIAAKKGNMAPLIVFTKCDLLQEFPEQRSLLETLKQIYESLGVPVFTVSVSHGSGLAELQKSLAGKATVFSGQSGVGKSSLINAITGLNLRTADVIEATRKGSHTTTQAQLLPLPGGGWVVDTPGLRSFGVWSLDPSEVQGFFPEIAAAASQCRFHNCSHAHEPDCAVRLSVAEGHIHPLRFESFQALQRGEGIRELLDWLEAD